MKFLASLFFLTSALFADASYHTLLEQFPEALGRLGSWKQGEIEIATSKTEIQKIEDHCYHRLLRKGYSVEKAKLYSRVGIIAEDQYWIWIRDAVHFPGGIMGTYDRLLWKSALQGPSGAAVLAVMKNKKIVLNINFRHATRSWELELPRGLRFSGESIQDAVARELKEETGCIANEFILLGNTAPDSGVIGGTIPVYFGQVVDREKRHLDEGEAIAKNIALSVGELQKAFINGYFITDINGRKTKVYCRDSFLSFALLQALWQKLI